MCGRFAFGGFGMFVPVFPGLFIHGHRNSIAWSGFYYVSLLNFLFFLYSRGKIKS
jgi:hypothetical protein